MLSLPDNLWEGADPALKLGAIYCRFFSGDTGHHGATLFLFFSFPLSLIVPPILPSILNSFLPSSTVSYRTTTFYFGSFKKGVVGSWNWRDIPETPSNINLKLLED